MSSPVAGSSPFPLKEGPLAVTDRVERIRGIGPRWAAQLAELGVETVGDLLSKAPFRYEDRRQLQPLDSAREGVVITAVGLIQQCSVIRTRGRRMEIVTALLDDGTAAIPLRFFNQGWLAQHLTVGTRLLVHGVPRYGKRGLELGSPEFELLAPGEDPNSKTGWIPVYEKLGPLLPKRIRPLIEAALERLIEPDDPIKEAVSSAIDLSPLRAAWSEVHRPPANVSAAELLSRRTAGHKRMAFDEFFLLELGLALRRAARRREQREEVYEIGSETIATLAKFLPYRLTAAQHRAVEEIFEDLRAPHPMHRLLLGDVGSGKTAVALLAMLVAERSGKQAALMAPTEILAAQHARHLQTLLLEAGIKVDLITAGLPAAQLRAARERVATGQARLVVGTHALLSEQLTFRQLGLVVIDEQHRFGVSQRADLLGKGKHPDMLVMSATPIPRTLAMVMYGDLEVSVLDEKPPGRKPIKTLLRGFERREQVLEGIGAALAQKRQIFVVRPAVEEGPKQIAAAIDGAAEYQKRFPQVKVALVHGRQKGSERALNLAAFSEGRAQILVATTVIEVGIDVPNASVMVVEDADRFGLAQLHQLRGRVGRGDLNSYCVLLAAQGAAPAALERLQVLIDTDDGFRVAERDLEIRGPGELVGTAQHGYPAFQVADLVRHADILQQARRLAFQTVGSGSPAGLPAALRKLVTKRFGPRLRLAEMG